MDEVTVVVDMAVFEELDVAVNRWQVIIRHTCVVVSRAG